MAEFDVLLPDMVAFQKLPMKTFFHYEIQELPKVKQNNVPQVWF